MRYWAKHYKDWHSNFGKAELFWYRLRSLRLRKFCTCGSLVSMHNRDRTTSRHYLNCDLLYRSNFVPRKKKQFIFFYPLVKK